MTEETKTPEEEAREMATYLVCALPWLDKESWVNELEIALTHCLAPLLTQLWEAKERVRQLSSACTCGSGAHPRECGFHGPLARKNHVLELNYENAVEGLKEAEAQVSALTQKLAEAQATIKAYREDTACICGCIDSEHEDYGEDGACCGKEGHECIYAPISVGDMVRHGRARINALEHQVSALTRERDTFRDSGAEAYSDLRKAEGRIEALTRERDEAWADLAASANHICAANPDGDSGMREPSGKVRDFVILQWDKLTRERDDWKEAARKRIVLIGVLADQKAALTQDRAELLARIGPISPGGDDRIDELEEANELLRHRVEALTREKGEAEETIAVLREEKRGAYEERNRVVAFLASLFPASLERHPDEDTTWEDDWRWVVYIDLPHGQASWHIHDSHVTLFKHVKRIQGRMWDGHTTEQKYASMEAALSPATGAER